MEVKAPVKGKDAKHFPQRYKTIELWTHYGTADDIWEFQSDDFTNLTEARSMGQQFIEEHPEGVYQIVIFTLGSLPPKK